MSAAADWSRFPLGTRFRIVSTREEYIIDDYGTALVGTSTIDLYKPTKLEMKRWGVRNVDIDILQWGSEEESFKVLGPRAKHPTRSRMITALQKKAPSTSKVATTSNSTSKQTASRSREPHFGLINGAVRRFSRRMKILVVGGAGYIGSVCAELLLDEGHRSRSSTT